MATDEPMTAEDLAPVILRGQYLLTGRYTTPRWVAARRWWFPLRHPGLARRPLVPTWEEATEGERAAALVCARALLEARDR